MLAGEALDCCELSLMQDSGENTQDQNGGKNADGNNHTWQSSAGNKDSTGNWT